MRGRNRAPRPGFREAGLAPRDPGAIWSKIRLYVHICIDSPTTLEEGENQGEEHKLVL